MKQECVVTFLSMYETYIFVLCVITSYEGMYCTYASSTYIHVVFKNLTPFFFFLSCSLFLAAVPIGARH